MKQPSVADVIRTDQIQPPSVSLDKAGPAGASSAQDISVVVLAAGENWVGTGAGDTHTGTSGDDTLNGAWGADSLVGGEGNDQLYNNFSGFEPFVDTLVGGTGDDTYHVHTGDIVIENAGEGVDTVMAMSDFTLGAGQSIERIVISTISGHGLNVAGNDLGNIIYGADYNDTITGGAGADTLSGHDGNDYLIGGAGADQFDGLTGNDTVSYEDYIAEDGIGGLVINLQDSSQNTGIAAGDVYQYGTIESVVGTNYRDLITGTALANTIAGGAGDDTLNGGAGSDLLHGGDGIDMASYAGSSAGIVVNLADPTGNTLEAAGDTYVSIEGVIGSSFNDTITGDDNANILDGGKGLDSLAGGKGDDTYIVDTYRDVILEEADGGHDTVVVIKEYFSLEAALEVEDLRALGGASVVLIGNGKANQITGSELGDQLDGGSGADTLVGGGGDDDYSVDDLDDVVVERDGGGHDTVYTNVDFTLGDFLENLRVGSMPAPLLPADPAGFRLTGNGLENQIVGGDGNDTLDGGGPEAIPSAEGRETTSISSMTSATLSSRRGAPTERTTWWPQCPASTRS